MIEWFWKGCHKFCFVDANNFPPSPNSRRLCRLFSSRDCGALNRLDFWNIDTQNIRCNFPRSLSDTAKETMHESPYLVEGAPQSFAFFLSHMIFIEIRHFLSFGIICSTHIFPCHKKQCRYSPFPSRSIPNRKDLQ